jgi:hypothetical protein
MKKYSRVLYSIVIAVAAVWCVIVVTGVTSFLFAWVFNLMLMMVVLAVMQMLMPPLRSPYFHSKTWEAGGTVYKWIGINLFRKLLVWVGWEKMNKASAPVKKKLAALQHLEYNSRQSEFGHLVIFFIVLAVAVFVHITHGFKQSAWMHFLNVVLNLYPAALQRYNRPRYQRAIAKAKGRIARD